MNKYKFNLYEALGVARDATQLEIKQAYLNQAKKFHPDMNSDQSDSKKRANIERMYRINEAYSILSNAGQRIRYDLAMELMEKMNPPASLLEQKIDNLINKGKGIFNNADPETVETVYRRASSIFGASFDLIKRWYQKQESPEKGKK